MDFTNMFSDPQALMGLGLMGMGRRNNAGMNNLLPMLMMMQRNRMGGMGGMGPGMGAQGGAGDGGMGGTMMGLSAPPGALLNGLYGGY